MKVEATHLANMHEEESFYPEFQCYLDTIHPRMRAVVRAMARHLSPNHDGLHIVDLFSGRGDFVQGLVKE